MERLGKLLLGKLPAKLEQVFFAACFQFATQKPLKYLQH